ncbi:MAG: LysE family transporter [Bacteroidales bacterium]|nr:LysE family transporter [Bacteroidales bacterium]
MDIIIKGFITGLLLSICVGATFFMLMETSMSRGFKTALWFDLGVVLCDTVIIIAVYFFATWITHTIIQNAYFNLAGGLVFVGFGLNYILLRHRSDTLPQLKNRNLKLFMNGFFINLMNPSVILFWLGTMAFSLSKLKLNGQQAILYYGTTLLVMALFDVIKAYFAYRISSFINKKVLRIIYIFSGLVMIGLGVYFFFL